MRPFKNKLFLLMIALLVFVTACAPSSSGGGHHGGQDGGGGQVRSSTPQEVRAAITKAYDLAGREAGGYGDLFARFYLSETAGSFEEVLPEGSKLFPKFDLNVPWNEADYSSPGLQAVLKQTPRLIESGDCQQGSRAHADASVSRYDLAGRVCFSIHNLSRLTPDSLLPEILSLIVHEALHLSGVRDENVAEQWQNSFRDYFHWRFDGYDSDQLARRIERIFFLGTQYLETSKRFNETTPGYLGLYTAMGAYGHLMHSSTHFLDPVYLDLAIRPKNRELVDNYSNAILALYLYVRDSFAPEQESFMKLRPREIKLRLQKISELHEIARANFFAYLDGRTVSTCIFPRYSDLPVELRLEHMLSRKTFTGHDSQLSNLVPPRVCSKGTVEKQFTP